MGVALFLDLENLSRKVKKEHLFNLVSTAKYIFQPLSALTELEDIRNQYLQYLRHLYETR